MHLVIGGFDFYSWVILPVIIFICRIGDVSLGTLRSVFISKGFKNIVPFIGFFEALLWIIIVAQIIKNLNNVACYFAFAGGFATGTYVGLQIEERLALGLQVIRIITNQNCDDLLVALKQNNHGVTIVDAMGSQGPVKMVFTIIKRKDVQSVVKLIQVYNPSAFYSIEEIKNTNQGVFNNGSNGGLATIKRLFPVGKGK